MLLCTRLKFVSFCRLYPKILLRCFFEKKIRYAVTCFNDAGLIALCRGCPLLEFIDLCGSRYISNVAVEEIAKLKHLNYLNLTWSQFHVTDEGMLHLARGKKFFTLISKSVLNNSKSKTSFHLKKGSVHSWNNSWFMVSSGSQTKELRFFFYKSKKRENKVLWFFWKASLKNHDFNLLVL